ncbi:MAG TPA: ABC transporter ATP-binding protein [Actinomycetota bacterium]|nr:ABC transporter ATP-binding protein [Actinomycetota bacterium]
MSQDQPAPATTTASPDQDGQSTEEPAAPERAPLLEVRDLHTTYPIRRGMIGAIRRLPRQWVKAVDGVSFKLDTGEMVALVGESGCGKTSTAQTILRMVDSQSGSILVNGQDITKLEHKEMRPLRRSIQMIYQDPYESLDPRFRVGQTIEEPMLIHGVGKDDNERHEIIVNALIRAGLTPPELYIDRYPHELSGGQRQRAAIAASLVLDPELLVADEPVSMLDVSVRAGILTLLDGLRRSGKMGIVMITHDLSTAAHFADRIAVMYLGRIVEQGPAKQVVRNPQHPYTKALLSVVPKRDPRDRTVPQILQGETPNPVNVPPGCRFHPRCPVAEARCKTIDPELHVVSTDESEHEAACILV